MAGPGAPKGNRYGVTHGLALIRNQIKRRTKRGRSYVDKRTHEGQDALRIQAGLVEDASGLENITTARFIAIKELSQLYYVAAMMDRATTDFLHKNPQYGKSIRALSRLFSYRAPVTGAIVKYLDVLGLDKLPTPVRTLEEILAESESETDQRNDDDSGDNNGEALWRDREEAGSRDAPASEEAAQAAAPAEPEKE